jgi:hypothetical protein
MDTLTIVEEKTLADLESIITTGMRTFEKVGNALRAIRDGRLYRSSHGTFEAYCLERWAFKRAYAYRLIESAQVVNNLSPIGNKPTNEAQARPLARLEVGQQAEAWEAANEIAQAEGRNVTARDVEAASRIVSVGANAESGRVAATKEAAMAGEEAEADSAGLWRLKSAWRKAKKIERKLFLAWIQTTYTTQ